MWTFLDLPTRSLPEFPHKDKAKIDTPNFYHHRTHIYVSLFIFST